MNKFFQLFTVVSVAFTTSWSFALPDDAEQEMLVEANSSEMFLNEGKIIYRGSDQEPARITQGSLVISGMEIIIIKENGVLQQINATGVPAHFEQQPQVNQGTVYADGETLIFNNANQLVTVQGNASFLQDGNSIKGDLITYNIETRRANASSSGASNQVKMVLPPQNQPTSTPVPPAESQP